MKRLPSPVYMQYYDPQTMSRLNHGRLSATILNELSASFLFKFNRTVVRLGDNICGLNFRYPGSIETTNEEIEDFMQIVVNTAAGNMIVIEMNMCDCLICCPSTLFVVSKIFILSNSAHPGIIPSRFWKKSAENFLNLSSRIT